MHQVLFCGDLLFNGGTPFLLMGSVTGASTCYLSARADPGAHHRARSRRAVRPRSDRHDGRTTCGSCSTSRGRASAPGLSPLEAAGRPTSVHTRAGWTRAHRRQPAPRLPRPRAAVARRRPYRRADRHGRLQRRPPPVLLRVTGVPESAAPWQRQPGYDAAYALRDLDPAVLRRRRIRSGGVP